MKKHQPPYSVDTPPVEWPGMSHLRFIKDQRNRERYHRKAKLAGQLDLQFTVTEQPENGVQR